VGVCAVDWSLENAAFGLGLGMQKKGGRQWGDRGGNTGVHISCETVGYQGIGELCKNLPYSMVAQLVEEIQSWVIGDVNGWLVWVS